jgi:hypothetical protein
MEVGHTSRLKKNEPLQNLEGLCDPLYSLFMTFLMSLNLFYQNLFNYISEAIIGVSVCV